MANQSSFAYVKGFESDPTLLPNCWVVVRLDGWAFGSFAAEHKYAKPVDDRGVALMNECAVRVMEAFPDVCLAYGHSDEYSFVLKKDAELFRRRRSKVESLLASSFAAWFAHLFAQHFPDTPLQRPAAFDARAVCYPSDKNLRDYLSWRQVDCHVNNQFNYCYWALVHAGADKAEAMQRIQGTDTEIKNELLFKEHGTNYNDLPAAHRRGSVVVREPELGAPDRKGNRPVRWSIAVLHEDIVPDAFWDERPWLLASLKKKAVNELVRSRLK